MNNPDNFLDWYFHAMKPGAAPYGCISSTSFFGAPPSTLSSSLGSGLESGG